MAVLPPALDEIVALFSGFSEAQRRDALLACAAAAALHEPAPGERFDLVDERIDPGCVDVVAWHLRREPDGTLRLRVRCGPRTQTLTRAFAALLCRGLDGATPRHVTELCDDIVPCLVGETLLKFRKRSVFRILHRLQELAAALPPHPPCPPTP
jgi:cysteine desulfuration protein SufE